MTTGALAEPRTQYPGDALGVFARSVARYGASAAGPIAVSGAHFLLSLIFLHAFLPTEFGVFSFLLVVVPFCLSLSTSLLGVSVTTLVGEHVGTSEIGTLLKANLLFAGLAAVFVFALLVTIRTPLLLALLLAAYAGAMTLRWFARSYAYATRTPFRAAISDLAYGIFAILPVAALAAVHELSSLRAAMVLLGASLLGLAVFPRAYLARQFWPEGSLTAYRFIWRDLTRWSLMGVVLTEMTANAHAYLVTLIAGPGAFALLAIGALLMRPVSLVYAALPDLERPAIARAIKAGDNRRAFRIVKEFRTAVGAMWVVTILAAGAVLFWFPHLVLKKGYGQEQALIVAAMFAGIMAIRALRTPESVLLQAAREFRPLARASLWSSGVSLAATLVLLIAFGPVASLLGILAGEGLLASNIFALSRRWRASHA